MTEDRASAYFLLSCFAEFYEAVAEIKLANRDGRLAVMFGNGDQPFQGGAPALAAVVSGRLADLLEAQLNRVAREQPFATARAHRVAAYTMAALADEIFVLELDWAGQNAWLDVLLEHRLFKTRIAGRKVFALIRKILAASRRDALHADLAAVYLMALQLGFKGENRGLQSEPRLQELRAQLFALLQNGVAASKLGFPQAYRHIDADSKPARLAPLRPWYVGGAVVLGIYLLISTVTWLRLTQPVLDAIAGR